MKPAVRERWVAALLLVCVGLVTFWLFAAKQAARGFSPLRLGSEDFAAFTFSDPAWQARVVFVKSTPIEPTITAYELRPVHPAGATVDPGRGAPILVRFVHGYNMVDCMRIKQFDVKLLGDDRAHWRDTGRARDPGEGPPMQVWRLTEPRGPGRVWVSSMLLASNFSGTTVDTRDMAFPRIGVPDDPAYVPTGLKWSSFRHPIRNLRYFLRARWNASRTDILTFLRLRQPAWASDVMITMVSEYRGHDAPDRTDAEMMPQVVAAHQAMYRELRRFAQARN